MRLLSRVLLLISFPAAVAFAEPRGDHKPKADQIAQHPTPKDPIFIPDNWYDVLLKSVPTPPTKESKDQQTDEAELRAYESSRTAADCERAKSEVYVSLSSFYGPPRGPLNKGQVDALTPFFEQVRNDSDFFIQKLKKAFPRERPFLYLSGIKPCIAQEVTGSYPSGHAAISKVFALVLSSMFPSQKAVFEKRAQQIADDRVLSAMHHRSDVIAGRKIGELIYRELLKSEAYQAGYQQHLAKAKQQTAPARRAPRKT